MLDAMNEFYETSYANVHRGVYRLAERATEALETRAREGADASERPVGARDHLRPQRDRGDQPRRLRVGAREPRAGRPRRRHASSSTTRTSSPGSTSRSRTGAGFRMIPLDEHGELRLDELDGSHATATSRSSRPGSSPTRSARSTRSSELAAWAHEHGAIMVADARPVGAAQGDGRPGARLRLRRDLGAQDVRPERRRGALGAGASCSRRWSRS